MLFGWAVEQGVSSNSVLFVKDGVTAAIGTGEQDRVGVAQIAIFKAYTKYHDWLSYSRHQIPFSELKEKVRKGSADPELLKELEAQTQKDKAGLIGSTMVSDGFFPFRDGLEVGLKEGITAVIQPGGSLRDYKVIETCNQAKPPVTMVFTGQRAFKH
jgi:phosphoribosylaminoimidazolecarboxamide formyltransferase/IMP cyclohydrolase